MDHFLAPVNHMKKLIAILALVSALLLTACELEPMEGSSSSGSGNTISLPSSNSNSSAAPTFTAEDAADAAAGFGIAAPNNTPEVTFDASGKGSLRQTVGGQSYMASQTAYEIDKGKDFKTRILAYTSTPGLEWLEGAVAGSEIFFYNKADRPGIQGEGWRAFASSTPLPNGKFPVVIIHNYVSDATLVHELLHVADNQNVIDPQEVASYAPQELVDKFLDYDNLATGPAKGFSDNQAREEMVADMYGSMTNNSSGASPGAYTERLYSFEQRDYANSLQEAWFDRVVSAGIGR